MTVRHRYPHKDGDIVALTEAARVDGYWFDQEFMIRGSYDRAHMLPGAVGVVVKAKTPAVWSGGELPDYFANVDIPYFGQKIRVRVYHTGLRKATALERSACA